MVSAKVFKHEFHYFCRMKPENYIRALIFLLVGYLLTYSGLYYTLSGKPDMNCIAGDSPISFVITGDQSLFSPGRENNTKVPGETQIPFFDLKKKTYILPGTENFYEPAFKTAIILLIANSKTTLKNPAVSQIIFPFDYFW